MAAADWSCRRAIWRAGPPICSKAASTNAPPRWPRCWRPAPTRAPDGYRLGLFAKRIGGAEVYFHLGYWGTAAYYCPALRLAMAGFTARRETRTGMLAVMESALETALLDPDPFLNTPAPLA